MTPQPLIPGQTPVSVITTTRVGDLPAQHIPILRPCRGNEEPAVRVGVAGGGFAGPAEWGAAPPFALVEAGHLTI